MPAFWLSICCRRPGWAGRRALELPSAALRHPSSVASRHLPPRGKASSAWGGAERSSRFAGMSVPYGCRRPWGCGPRLPSAWGWPPVCSGAGVTPPGSSSRPGRWRGSTAGSAPRPATIRRIPATASAWTPGWTPTAAGCGCASVSTEHPCPSGPGTASPGISSSGAPTGTPTAKPGTTFRPGASC